MGLTGLDIYKQLPKKNCGECGPPTCLAFAMALAAGKAELSACPYVSEEAKENLAAAAAPPIRLVKIGTGDEVVEVGDETVIFRHEKTFFHPTGIAIRVSDAEDVEAKLAKIKDLVLERVGQVYEVDLVAVSADSGDPGKFAAAVEKVAQGTDLALMLIGGGEEIRAALDIVADRKPLLYAADAENYEEMTNLAKEKGCPLVVKGTGLDDLAELVKKVEGLGHKELVLDSGNRELSRVLADLTQIRRLAIKKRFRPFGYPTVAFTTKDDPKREVVEASVFVAKYAGIVVLKACEREHLLPLLSWRQNLYTDPQKPIQVESKLYEVGNVNADSPVYVTTNFSLTYFTVEGEVEASKVPAYIIPVNTDGTSVLTAWAAGKFEAEHIAEMLEKTGVAEKVSHRDVIIPGYVAVLSGKLKEVSGWNVIVGPREAAGIPAFVRERYGGR